MGNRRVPPSIFLPTPQSPRDGTLNQAIVDMYRPIQRRIEDEIQEGTLAQRPASTGGQRFYFATDTGQMFFDSSTGGWSSLTEALGPIVNGSFATIVSNSESITFSATPKDSVANILRANSLVLAVTTRVTTALTNVTSWEIGDPTTAARFSTAGIATLGSTIVGINQWSGAVTTLASGPSQAAAAQVRLTRTAGAGTPAGVVKVVVYSLVFGAPTS